MSDEDDKTKGGKGKGPPTDRDKAKVDALPKNEQFFLWLEKLFDGQEHFPEKLDVRVVRGKDMATMGPMIKQIPWPADKAKPTKEALVALSNEILYLVQHDCDQSRKSVVYHVAAIHFSRSPEPYERWLIRCNPGATFKNGESGDENNEDDDAEKRLVTQVMRHHESMFGLTGASLEGVVDRQDRIIERLLARNEKLEGRTEKLVDMLERALSLESERLRAAKWDDMKIQSAQKALDMGMALAPPLLNQLVGKQVMPTADTAETITLKEFFKTVEDGGRLTKEQANAAFGVWDDTPEHNLVSVGILSPEQAAILYQVAFGKIAPDELNKLMPGERLGVSMEQAMGLQKIFPMEQLAPILIIFEARRKAMTKE